jgi:hypothetical protein
MTKLPLLAASLLVVGACSDRSLKDAPVRDANPPLLHIITPDRGAVDDDGSATVHVTGTATDAESGIDTLSINGQTVPVGLDGSFAVDLPVEPGITLIMSGVSDKAGNFAHDTRAVMAGTMVPIETPVTGGMVMQLQSGAFDVMGQVGAKIVDQTDFTPIAAAANPVVNVGPGSCLYAQVDVDAVKKGDVTIALSPVDGGVQADVTINNLEVDTTVPFDVACFDSSTDVTMWADAFHLSATMAVGLDDTGALAASVVDSSDSFDNFQMDTVLPDVIDGLIAGPVSDYLTSTIADQIKQKLPDMVKGLIGDIGQDKQVPVLGQTLSIGIHPTQVDFTSAGATITLDSQMYIANETNGMSYVQTPVAAPTFGANADAQAVNLALADDALNQVFASFWAAGVLDQTVQVNSSDYAGIGVVFDAVQVKADLPPYVEALPDGQGLRVMFGDIEASFLRKDDVGDHYGVVTKLAISGKVTLQAAVSAQNTMSLSTSNIITWVDVLDEGVTGGNPLDDATVEALGSFAAKGLIGYVSTLASSIPIPSYQGATLTNGTIKTGESDGGYLLVGGDLVMQ